MQKPVRLVTADSAVRWYALRRGPIVEIPQDASDSRRRWQAGVCLERWW